MNYLYIFISLLLIIIFPLVARSDSINPCDSANLISMINRPSNADSACTTPYTKMILESGVQYQSLYQRGQQQNFPQSVVRFGLPINNEVVIQLPNFIHQSNQPHQGATAITLGVKHEISDDWPHLITSIEGLITPPSGSDHFGSDGVGGTINSITSYDIHKNYNLTFMLGTNTTTQAHAEGGQRFTSVNPDLIITWSPREVIAAFGEIYGQSKTAPDSGSGFNMDTGIIYLLYTNLALDVEVGQRLSGHLNGFNHYIGSGISLLF